MRDIKLAIGKLIKTEFNWLVRTEDFSLPPNSRQGDLCLPCFVLAKDLARKPVELAAELATKLSALKKKNLPFKEVGAVGPYVNFFIEDQVLRLELEKVDKNFGRGKNKKQKIMVEFAHPNTHKAFHIGHLRNIVTGESLSRILANSGFSVIRANYQGDVGLHIAKALWGLEQLKDEFEKVRTAPLEDRIKFLGKAYALGGQSFETEPKTQEVIKDYNTLIYEQDKKIEELYKVTRQWSLDYFDQIYSRVYTRFDRFYFESETFARGVEIVKEFLAKDVFKASEGAIIFEGEKFNLHSRVFINSKGYPTYEAKDLALAELQVKEFKPAKIIHVVGKEQQEYFKVIFKALEFTLAKAKTEQIHLAYGWVSLKSGKMSSRTGQVVLGEWLLEEVKTKIKEIMLKNETGVDEETAEIVAVAAVKYAMLSPGVTVDMAFDINESVSLSGNSGPYLLYIVARINSILAKVQGLKSKIKDETVNLKIEERDLMKKILEFPEITEKAAQKLDPSEVAKYLFDLAQTFNGFYQVCPVLRAEGAELAYRVDLIKKVSLVMEKGLDLLGIKTVKKM